MSVDAFGRLVVLRRTSIPWCGLMTNSAPFVRRKAKLKSVPLSQSTAMLLTPNVVLGSNRMLSLAVYGVSSA